MGCEYAKKERECLKLSECGLRGMIYGRVEPQAK